jgi:AcrR family transcriptional regulator
MVEIMVQQERARVTRDVIIAGAARAFENFGFGMASLADIIAEAGVTKGAVYFRSKDEIARAVIEEQHRLSYESGQQILALGRPGLETMILMSGDLARQLMTDPVVKAGIRLTTEVSNFDRPVLDPYRDWLNTFESLIHRAIAEGDVRADLPAEKLARFIIPAFTGVQLVSDTFAKREDLLQRVREMWEILLPGIVSADRYPGLKPVEELIPL